MPHSVHQDFDGFMTFKGTSSKVLDQGNFFISTYELMVSHLHGNCLS